MKQMHRAGAAAAQRCACACALLLRPPLSSATTLPHLLELRNLLVQRVELLLRLLHGEAGCGEGASAAAQRQDRSALVADGVRSKPPWPRCRCPYLSASPHRAPGPCQRGPRRQTGAVGSRGWPPRCRRGLWGSREVGVGVCIHLGRGGRAAGRPDHRGSRPKPAPPLTFSEQVDVEHGCWCGGRGTRGLAAPGEWGREEGGVGQSAASCAPPRAALLALPLPGAALDSSTTSASLLPCPPATAHKPAALHTQ